MMPRTTALLLAFTAFAIAPTCPVAAQFPSADQPMPHSLDLPLALTLALDHNPAIRIAREQIREREGLLIELRARGLPGLNLSGTYAATDPGRIESFGPSTTPLDQSWVADINVTYTLYDGGLNRSQRASASAAARAAENTMRAVVNDVLLKTALRYFDALLERGRASVQEQEINVLAEQLTNTQNRFEAGTGPQFNVLQAEVALANARPPLIRSRSQYRLAVDQLRRTIGLPYATGAGPDDIQLTSDWPTAAARQDLAASLRIALDQRPELAAAAAEIEVARSEINAERARTRANVEVVGGYGVQSESFSTSATDAMAGWGAGLRVSVPLMDFGLSQGRRQQAEARLRQTELSLRQHQLDVEGEVREAWLSSLVAVEILETSQLVVDQAGEALRLTRASFDAGAATQLDVLQAQLGLSRSRTEQVEARHVFHSSLAQLRRAIGAPPPSR
jgi:outer membrane protein